MSVDNNIPKGWVETKLEDVCHKITDGSHQSPKGFKGGYPMLSVKDMNEFGFDIENSKTISKEDYIKLSKQGCKPEINDILIAKDGSVLKHIFKVGKEIKGVLLSSIAIVKPNINSINPDYLVFIIVNPIFKKYILNNFLSGSGVPRIVLKDFKKIEFNLPPLQEQKAIAKILTSFDDKIELLQAQNKTLETTAQTIFKEWFGKYQIDDELPEDWRVGKLGNYGKIITGKTPSKNNTEYWGKDKPFITPTDFKNFGLYSNQTQRYLSKTGWDRMNTNQIPKNSIMVTCIGSDMGKVCINSKDSITNQQINSIIIENQLYIGFVYEFIKSQYQNLRTIALGGSTMPIINKSDFSNIEIPIPEDKLLLSFQNLWNPISLKILVNATQIQTLKKTRDTLLPKLMSGQLRVDEFKEKE